MSVRAQLLSRSRWRLVRPPMASREPEEMVQPLRSSSVSFVSWLRGEKSSPETFCTVRVRRPVNQRRSDRSVTVSGSVREAMFHRSSVISVSPAVTPRASRAAASTAGSVRVTGSTTPPMV